MQLPVTWQTPLPVLTLPHVPLQRVPQLRPCSAPSSAAPARRPAVAVAALPAPRSLGVRVKGSVHAAPVPLSPVPSPSSRGPLRTPGTFQRLGSASWGSFAGSIQSTARSGSGSGSSSSLSSVLLQQPSRLSVVTAAQRRGEKALLLFGDSSTQVRVPSAWGSVAAQPCTCCSATAACKCRALAALQHGCPGSPLLFGASSMRVGLHAHEHGCTLSLLLSSDSSAQVRASGHTTAQLLILLHLQSNGSGMQV